MSKLYKIPILVAMALLLLASINSDLDSGYFTLLRIIVCGVAVYLTIIAQLIKKYHWMWIAGFIAILFNPIIPIHFEEETWQSIDFAAATIFFVTIFALSTGKNVFKIKVFRNIIIVIAIIIGLCVALISLAFFLPNQDNKAGKNDVAKKTVNEEFDWKTARPMEGSVIEESELTAIDSKGNQDKLGNITAIGRYANGEREDTWKVYDQYGALKAEKTYKGGALNEDKIFDEKGELIKGDTLSLPDFLLKGDLNMEFRKKMILVDTGYEDDNVKIVLLPPYWETKDKRALIAKMELEIVNRTKIISINPGLCELTDNYGNTVSLWSRPRSDGQDNLRFGDKKTITFYSDTPPIMNSIYFNMKIDSGSLGNLRSATFIFPASFIAEEKTGITTVKASSEKTAKEAIQAEQSGPSLSYADENIEAKLSKLYRTKNWLVFEIYVEFINKNKILEPSGTFIPDLQDNYGNKYNLMHHYAYTDSWGNSLGRPRNIPLSSETFKKKFYAGDKIRLVFCTDDKILNTASVLRLRLYRNGLCNVSDIIFKVPIEYINCDLDGLRNKKQSEDLAPLTAKK